MNTTEIQETNSNVITVTINYGQLIPVKAFKSSQAIPTYVCTRWGGIFQRNSIGFFEPVSEAVLTIQECAERDQLVKSPWILPIKKYTPIEPSYSNRVEELEDLFAKYRNK